MTQVASVSLDTMKTTQQNSRDDNRTIDVSWSGIATFFVPISQITAKYGNEAKTSDFLTHSIVVMHASVFV